MWPKGKGIKSGAWYEILIAPIDHKMVIYIS